jgi:3-hydroxyisobutyrate dehydrogenase
MPDSRIGVVGTGIMGRPMALNLAKAGFDVTAYNRTAARAEALAKEGITVAKSVAEVGESCTVVITMVPDTDDVLEVVEGEGGLASSMKDGSVLIDMSTIAPGPTGELAARLVSKGIAMLDAPVSGGSWGAQQGTLSIMVGGEQATFERCLPVFDAIGKTIMLMGPSGMGQTTKLVNQILVVGVASTVAEALVFAAANGADLLKTIEVVGGGAAGSWLIEPWAAHDPERFRSRIYGKAPAERPPPHPRDCSGQTRPSSSDLNCTSIFHRARSRRTRRRRYASHHQGGRTTGRH